jgi:hypothetical protein
LIGHLGFGKSNAAKENAIAKLDLKKLCLTMAEMSALEKGEFQRLKGEIYDNLITIHREVIRSPISPAEYIHSEAKNASDTEKNEKGLKGDEILRKSENNCKSQNNKETSQRFKGSSSKHSSPKRSSPKRSSPTRLPLRQKRSPNFTVP